jgi:hypothetical protein
MYIVIETNKETCESIVIFASNDYLKANVQFIEHIDKLTLTNDTAQYFTKNIAHIYKKNVGWISSTKDICYVVQLITFDNPIEDTDSSDVEKINYIE